ncbi:MAG: hypothetical protein K8T26_19545 [Lentisphaerae bacterium]|nr:hypothetical protein [Lentisphaerota bacterium]
MSQQSGLGIGQVRTSQPFQDVVSKIFGPGPAVLRPSRWRLEPHERDFAWRAVTVMAIVVLAVGVVLKVKEPEPPALTIAAVGRCFIAPGGGEKWHSVLECPALARALNIEQVPIAEARRRGAASSRWRHPCALCGATLQTIPSARDKREEFDMLAEGESSRQTRAGSPTNSD